MENKIKYNGKEQQSKEFGDADGLDWYDYGARMYDAQVGRWMVADRLSEKYAIVSPYTFALNNPILLFDLDGREIGNPNDPFTKQVQTFLNSTQAGQELWVRMEASHRKIYFIDNTTFASKRTAEGTALNQYMYKSNAAGITMSESEYRGVIEQGTSPGMSENRLKFNENTGEYDKTEDFDNTYVVINKKIRPELAMYLGTVQDEQGNKLENDMVSYLQFMEIITHEANHTLQDFLDVFEKKKDPKTGKFIKNESVETAKVWEFRRNEIDSEEMANYIIGEFINAVLSELKK